MDESLKMYTFLERKFHENYNGDIDFFEQKSLFLENKKNMFFCHFSFETG